MEDEDKTKEGIIQELRELRERTARLERMKTELWLRGNTIHENELLYGTLLEQFPDAAYIFHDGKFEYFNTGFLNLFALTREEVQSGDFDFMSLVAPESHSVIEERILQALRGAPLPSRYVFTGLTRKGERIEIEAVQAYIPFKGRVATQGSFRIAERQLAARVSENTDGPDRVEPKKAEEGLKESERLLKDIITFLPDPMVVINEEGCVMAWNPAMEKLTRIREDDILGRGNYEYAVPFFGKRRPMLIDLVLKADDEIERQYANFKRQGGILSGEIFIADLNGKSVYFAVTAAALYDSRGNVMGAIECVHDISEQKYSEKAQKELEAELIQAQKMEAIGTLAGGIAHDFNNLLMGIQGYTSLMLLGLDADHPFYKKLKSIEEQVQSGADLTRQLLGFARGGRYEVRSTDLNEILQKTSLMFGRTKKEIRIQRNLKQDIWLIDADHGQIEQVLLNLYVNAWQAMPGGGELYLSTENVVIDETFVMPFQVKPGRYVKISVTDTGVGMDEKTRQRVFEPFFTTKEMGRGTGLGLATVYGIIKGHGGIINVYSEKGFGTTFNIYLPAAEEQSSAALQDQGSLLKGHETILLVDDEEMIIDVSKEILETLGYCVLLARTGKEAIEIYLKKKNEIGLVILDMIIPEMSGGDIFDKLKAIDPEVKVILSSGYSMNDQAAKIMERGCQAFIQKPFSMKELSQKVREVLETSKPQATPLENHDRIVKLEFRKGYKYDLR